VAPKLLCARRTFRKEPSREQKEIEEMKALIRDLEQTR
jgi:hypothetical protein